MKASAAPVTDRMESSEEERPLLTARQIECLAWAQEGKSAGDIAQIIGLSRRGVEKAFYTAYRRLDVCTRVQAVLRARELGLLGPQTRARWIEPETRHIQEPS